jgi:membrane protein required for colicin V production
VQGAGFSPIPPTTNFNFTGMAIDITLLILLALACFKGASRGLIVAVFSFLAIIIGLAAAMKLSVVVASWLQNSTNLNKQWLPFLSFFIVMICVVILVRWVARLLQKTVESVMMGWLNRLGGMVFFVLLYAAIYSVVLFYATEMGFLKPETIQSSKTYGLIEPFGPRIINALGALVPVFKNLFSDLEAFFGSFVHKK